MQASKTTFAKAKWQLKTLILATGLISANAMAGGIEGSWRSVAQINGERNVPIVIHLDEVNGEWTGTLDSPSLRKEGLEVSMLEIQDNSITFEVEDLQISYKGAYSEATDLMFGAVHQNVASPMNFSRTSESARNRPNNRPQTPQGPFPYTIEEVSFKNAATNNIISGTLTKPKSNIKATAVLISGSGPQDRDETLFGHKPFAIIADHLTRQGYAIFRYDDRGIGGSSGDFSAATSEDFANDTSAAVDFLNSRKDLPKGKVGLIGHSEGGMIAPMVASSRDDIAFSILLAGPGVKIPELIIDQWNRDRRFKGVPEEKLQKLSHLDKKIFDKLGMLGLKESINGEIEELLYESVKLEGVKAEELDVQVEQLKNQYSTPWFRYFLKFNPEPYLEKTKSPLLALIGSLDFQVDAKMNLNNIQSVLSNAGHKDFKTIELEKMNHLFQTAGNGSFSEYAEIEESFSPRALNIMSLWLNERF
ncbi:S9 family peptidase [Microbulbifer sp. THAF38]|uniref:alpha/beta hydrolase family protein n=1 Tax=Microbulbifer sp. THAF38 TaxID=2587856 RepID=UPI0012AAB0B5|nr:alpha/beta fold hydrolase [Microbulbifer sp. THAF38]QFT54477.1 Alpha/beta hydrolase family protein [Microbulbifer sp. THAF38]